ncbi:hypothetical protein ADU59_21255 [Pararhizobium polonicum]|uniref:Uncharacterized protein n=1 Tax=Pararhizobium polonicum TaxID=1612624 RepID=A0A1C7NXH0_9HYPH|nr:hypothetical protein [Pararhizobium polonicum]OBZ93396.1 hypothetical protein ADU59_21255 [Pararhizobium polonicum]
MKNQTASPQLFQRKISEFCQVRVAPVTSQRAFDNIRSYMLNLIAFRTVPPSKSGNLDWQEIAATCDLREVLTPALKRAIQPGLDAIARWLCESGKGGLVEPGRGRRKPASNGTLVRKTPSVSAPMEIARASANR